MDYPFYERLKKVCEEKNTSVTQVLRDIGRAEGNTGNWKRGRSPALEIVMEIAEDLGIGLDELVYGKKMVPTRDKLTDSELEILAIFQKIPEDKQDICKAFLKTHMVEEDK